MAANAGSQREEIPAIGGPNKIGPFETRLREALAADARRSRRERRMARKLYAQLQARTLNGQTEFDRERLDVVKRVLGDVKLSAITGRTVEGFRAERRLEGTSNRTVNMDVGVLRKLLKRFEQWRRLEDDVTMLTEAGGEPIGRVRTNEEQYQLFKTAEANAE